MSADVERRNRELRRLKEVLTRRLDGTTLSLTSTRLSRDIFSRIAISYVQLLHVPMPPPYCGLKRKNKQTTN